MVRHHAHGYRIKDTGGYPTVSRVILLVQADVLRLDDLGDLLRQFRAAGRRILDVEQWLREWYLRTCATPRCSGSLRTARDVCHRRPVGAR
jgi:hypothetical protein